MSNQGQFDDAELDVAVESEPEVFDGDHYDRNEGLGHRVGAVARPVSDWSGLNGNPLLVQRPNVVVKMEEEEVSNQAPVAVGLSRTLFCRAGLVPCLCLGSLMVVLLVVRPLFRPML